MLDGYRKSRWANHFIYRAEVTKTTWKFRLGLVAFVVIAPWLTSWWWTVELASGLVCEASRAPSDAILVENFESSYQAYERAAQLRREGFASRVLVQTLSDPDTGEPDEVALGRVQVMARATRIGEIEIVPTRQREPIMLNAVRDMQRFLEQERIRSLLVVMPLLRSRRSALVYEATLGRSGITVHCVPVHGSVGVDNWTQSWHGIQDVLQQWLKLQYYRLYALPFA